MSRMRLAVYTAILGDYDDPKPIGPDGPDVPYFCFTDAAEESPDAGGWRRVRVADAPETADGRTRLARDIKIRPHRWLPEYDAWIWIDGTLTLHASPLRLVREMPGELATFRHPRETVHDGLTVDGCLYQEAEACIHYRLDDIRVIRAQVARYRGAGYPSGNGLVETSLLVRRNSEAIRAFGEAWWAEVAAGSRRDQISFNYVAWRLGLVYTHLEGSRRDNPYTTYRTHRHRRGG